MKADFAHTTGSERGNDFVRTKLMAGFQRHHSFTKGARNDSRPLQPLTHFLRTIVLILLRCDV